MEKENKDTFKKAIKNGEAVDASVEPEKIKKYIEKGLGFLRDGFQDEDIDKMVENFSKAFIKQEIVFYGDIDFFLTKIIVKNIPIYFRNVVRLEIDNFKKDMKKDGDLFYEDYKKLQKLKK